MDHITYLSTQSKSKYKNCFIYLILHLGQTDSDCGPLSLLHAELSIMGEYEKIACFRLNKNHHWKIRLHHKKSILDNHLAWRLILGPDGMDANEIFKETSSSSDKPESFDNDDADPKHDLNQTFQLYEPPEKRKRQQKK